MRRSCRSSFSAIADRLRLAVKLLGANENTASHAWAAVRLAESFIGLTVFVHPLELCQAVVY